MSALHAGKSALVSRESGGLFAVFVQSGGAVALRRGDIAPGDVVVLAGARFAGRKGLQKYQVTVGAEDEPHWNIVANGGGLTRSER